MHFFGKFREGRIGEDPFYILWSLRYRFAATVFQLKAFRNFPRRPPGRPSRRSRPRGTETEGKRRRNRSGAISQILFASRCLVRTTDRVCCVEGSTRRDGLVGRKKRGWTETSRLGEIEAPEERSGAEGWAREYLLIDRIIKPGAD